MMFRVARSRLSRSRAIVVVRARVGHTPSWVEVLPIASDALATVTDDLDRASDRSGAQLCYEALRDTSSAVPTAELDIAHGLPSVSL